VDTPIVKILKRVGRLFIAFTCAALLVLITVENEPWFISLVERKIIALMRRNYEGDFSARVRRIHMLTGTLELEEVKVTSRDKQRWEWSCDRLLWQSSLVDILVRRRLPVRIMLQGVKLSSLVDQGKIAIVPYLLSFILTDDNAVPITVDSLCIRNGRVSLTDRSGYQFSSNVRTDLYFLEDHIKVKGMYESGTLSKEKVLLVEDIASSLEGAFSLSSCVQESVMQGTLEGTLSATRVPLSITLKVEKGDVKTTMSCGAESGMIKTERDADGMCVVTGKLPLLIGTSLLGISFVRGTAHLQAFSKDLSWQTFVQLEHMTLYDTALPNVAIEVDADEHEIKGKYQFTYVREKELLAQGSFLWNPHTNYGRAEGKLHDVLELGNGWRLYEGEVHGWTDTDAWQGNYNIKLGTTNKEEQVRGNLQLTSRCFEINGEGKEAHYHATFIRDIGWHVHQLQCDTEEHSLLHVDGFADGNLQGTLCYSLLRTLLLDNGFDVPGEGVIDFKGNIQDAALHLKLHMDDAHIKLPHSYHLIRGFDASLSIYPQQRELIVDDVCIVLHEGNIVCSQATCSFDPEYRISYCFVPLLFNNCFINWKKDFFALLCGGVTLSYIDSVPRIEGALFIDRPHVRDNVLSAEFQQGLMTDALHPLKYSWKHAQYALTLSTREPAQVKTSFLDTSVHLSVGIKGTVAQPELSGTLRFIQGSFEFPYQPLYITSGKLYFLPGQLHDPAIELSARNTIKRYGINMTVTGSLKHPKISFESSPYLEEEQIITLLLGGAEDGSLYAVMPTALTHSIEGLLFGPGDTSSGLQRYLRNLFRPLKNVRIVPSFSDQTGRGGLKGSIAVELNDRLRGLVQKNFSLSEDTRFEIEYALSDDTIIRAAKDERGDVGGEIETRWKW
jgi:TamB, inner membrane protein subunit of TAM complex